MAADNGPRSIGTTLLQIRTRPLIPPKDDLWDALHPALPPLEEGDVLAITSKIVAIHQGRCVPAATVDNIEDLIEDEAEGWIPKTSSKHGISLTIKGGTLIASAGIDASNANDHFVLWPLQPSTAAAEIGRALKKRYGLSRLGVILADSHCIPLRRGTVGIAIGFHGFAALKDYRGQPDIFGRRLGVTLSNHPDAMAAAAVGLMGEGAECVPAVIIRGWPGLEFNDVAEHGDFFIDPREDIFAPLLEAFWQHDQKKRS